MSNDTPRISHLAEIPDIAGEIVRQRLVDTDHYHFHGSRFTVYGKPEKYHCNGRLQKLKIELDALASAMDGYMGMQADTGTMLIKT